MATLTPYDVKRWDLAAIQMVFETANGRANTLQRLGDNLQQVHDTLSDWHGEAGEAFRADLGKARRDIEADGQESRQVAAAVSRAEGDVSACKRELADIERAADAKGWTITPDWRIDVGDTWIGRDPIELAAQRQLLQDRLIMLKVRADAADHELAAAIRAAVGEAPVASGGPPPGGSPPPQGARGPAPSGKPRTWQDMLLPDGPADAGPSGGPPTGVPSPAGGVGGKPPSLQDLLTDGAPNSDPQLQPGGLPGLLGLAGRPGAPGAPALRPTPADVESARALLRPIMLQDGVPPDQIEARLDQIVAGAQQWIDHGMPNYIPPEPTPPPPPGFGEGFADRWFATEQGIKNLLGQGGPGAPGVLESWQQMLKGTVETATNPVGTAVGEVKNLLDSPSPAYYTGGKTADGAFALPGLLFGGEGAAIRAGLGDIGPGVLDTGPAVSPHVPVGFDHPPTYNPWAEGAATDLNYSHAHGGPTVGLSQQLADMSTHYVGNNPDRVVLGKFDTQAGGYIGEARGLGGIYYDTGDPAWDAITNGLSRTQARDLTWHVNEQFLRGQMETGVPRFEYRLPQGFSSVEEVLALDADSFSAKEIAFLKSNAEAYGYQQVGNTWVRIVGRS
ncbi:hypothetical protein A5672_07985 [Mycobacterium alsense]|uniref:WXG100 family type VII secretion target n=1 Tax=Mycobacterium alsense TaxID=324058 RepID=A0ABD6P5T1_9MYCO|nr:hypothetical protein [Mycobacterium alsense]OBG46548.1 hypothetical protein A5672_07985 [Mycobacterium alsense]